MKKIIPIPEPIDKKNKKNKKWIKIDTSSQPNVVASVDIDKKIINVPFTVSERDYAVRAHEYGHIKYSPSRRKFLKKDVYFQTALSALEDFRINYLIHRNDAICLENLFSEDNYKFLKDKLNSFEDPSTLHPIERLQIVCDCFIIDSLIYQTKNNNLYNRLTELKRLIENKLTRIELELVESIKSKLLSKPTRFKPVPEQAEILADLYRPKEPKTTDGDGEGNLQANHHRKGSQIEKEKTPKTADEVSGKLNIEKNLDQINKIIVRNKKTSEFGYIPKRISNFFLNKKIFVNKFNDRKPKLFILIDLSGSMSWNIEEIEELVREFGNKTIIAGYSGFRSHGTLQFLALEGRVKTKITNYGSGNIVDFPALKYVIENYKKYKIAYITDSGFTGLGDKAFDVIDREITKLIVSNKVIVINPNNHDDRVNYITNKINQILTKY